MIIIAMEGNQNQNNKNFLNIPQQKTGGQINERMPPRNGPSENSFTANKVEANTGRDQSPPQIGQGVTFGQNRTQTYNTQGYNPSKARYEYIEYIQDKKTRYRIKDTNGNNFGSYDKEEDAKKRTNELNAS